jgi:hypothetical protein
MTEAEIRTFLRQRLGERLAQPVLDGIARKWVGDRIRATEWVMEGNDIIE